MKIIFENKKINKGTIKVSLDGGVTYTDYNIEDVVETGIPLDDSQDFSKVKIKGAASLLQSAEIVSSVKMYNNLILDTEKYGYTYPDNVVKFIYPAEITSIRSSSLSSYKNITSVDIPESVISIDQNAFANCTSLTSINIPNSVTSIGKNAFEGCSKLTSVTIPEGVTSIGEYTFSGCSSLTSINIPNSVTSIGNRSFSSCSSLAYIIIPSNVTTIAPRAFHNCYHLNIIVDENNQNYSASEDGQVLFNKDKTILICHLYMEGDYVVPAGITKIGDYAFSTIEIKNITMPDGVTEIGNHAFYECVGLESIVIPNSITKIGSFALSDCYGLKTINYKGTQEQWNAITKGSRWQDSTPDYIINYNYKD